MKYQKGEIVKHPTMEEWGIGKVLEDTATDTVKIFFYNVGEKTLSLKYVEPIKIPKSNIDPNLRKKLYSFNQNPKQKSLTTKSKKTKLTRREERRRNEFFYKRNVILAGSIDSNRRKH